MNPIKFVWFFVTSLLLITYLAFCDWLDERRAKRAGSEWEGE